jgi:hypothetical protein
MYHLGTCQHAYTCGWQSRQFMLTDGDECAHDNVEHGPCDAGFPRVGAVLVPVVVQPHTSHWLKLFFRSLA